MAGVELKENTATERCRFKSLTRVMDWSAFVGRQREHPRFI